MTRVARKARVSLLALAPLAALTTACGAPDRSQRATAWVVVETGETDPDAIDALASVRVTPAEAFARAVRAGTRTEVELDVSAARHGVRIDVPGSCPERIEGPELAAGTTVRRRLVPRLDLRGPAHPHDLGYGAPFSIEARLACDDAARGTFVWRQRTGEPLGAARGDGRRFEGQTAAEDPLDVARRPRSGIAPISARAANEASVEVEWHPAQGGDVVRRSLTVAAASRSHGLPNVAVDEGLLLAGAWTVAESPKGAAAVARTVGATTSLLPDVEGEWLVRDARGASLTLHAGRYDTTPLDCGRASCHRALTNAAAESPMTEALHALPAAARGCPTPCHATGGAEAHDGGFADLARALGVAVGDTPWEALPSALRRTAGVTCLGCHGPGAIPQPSARWALLRADVCATCHDAPPTYGHVAAWRASRMARADAAPATRAPECARCHTTSGFLASLDGTPDTRVAPVDAGPVGIACAACHAPHPRDGHARGAPLLREVPLPAWASRAGDASDVGRSVVCLSCHSPAALDATRVPAATAALLWAGKGGVDPASGSPLTMTEVHADLAGGCIGCHDEGPASLERGAAHAFRADPARCAGCHGDGFAAESLDRRVREEATALLARLAGPSAPGHAIDASHASPERLTDDAVGRATYDVLLVLEDPAAASHNEPYARALLAAAAGATR